MDTKLTLGQVIRSRRIELALTQEELAERIGEGVRQAEVSRLERDRIMLPRRARLEAIAAALELPLGELLARSGWSGADAIPWTPTIHADLPQRESLPEVAVSSGTLPDRPETSYLAAMIEQARETISKTHVLLTQSDETFDLVLRSVTRAHRAGASDKPQSSS
jgi:transcriptional regulator with XRE-family HTH domain